MVQTAATLPDAVSRQFSASLGDQLVALRRAIHQHPELAFAEIATADRLSEALTSLGVHDITRVGKTGIVARIRGRNSSAPTVAVRGDIDALPIHEATGLAFG